MNILYKYGCRIILAGMVLFAGNTMFAQDSITTSYKFLSLSAGVKKTPGYKANHEYAYAMYSDSSNVSSVTRPAADTLGVVAPVIVPKWYDMVWNVPGDFVRFYDVYMRQQYFPTFAAIAISTAGLMASDESTWRASERWYKSDSYVSGNSEFFKEFGDGRTQFMLAGAFALGGWVAGDARMLRTASQVVEVVLAAGGMVQVFKHCTGRESPFTETQEGGAWRFFPNQIEYHKHVPQYDAYPSGHICTTIATFIVIQDNYPEYPWIEPVGWVASALVGIGMVNTGIHWYSDYPLGLAMGYGFAKVVTERNKAKHESVPEEKVSYSIYPNFSPFGNGLGFSMKF